MIGERNLNFDELTCADVDHRAGDRLNPLGGAGRVSHRLYTWVEYLTRTLPLVRPRVSGVSL